MHILLVTSYYPSRDAPITGIFFHDQAMALYRAGHQVGVLVTPRIGATLETIRRSGLLALRSVTRGDDFLEFPVYRMHWGWFPRALPPMAATLVATAGFQAFDQYCQAHGTPDILHGHNIFYGGYLAARLRNQYRIPAVLTEHSTSYLEGLVILPGQPQIIRWTLQSIDARRAVGSRLAAAVQAYAPEVKISVLGNIVNTKYFYPDGLPPAPDPFVFAMIAQLKERRKGFDVLLKSFAQAFKGKNVHLHIGGHGPLRPELDRLIAKLGLGDRVKFFGLMTREEVRNMLRRSHALVSSSLVETFGVSVAEAIACGRPVVATICGGPEDYVTDRSGVLVEPGNVDMLAAGMQQMVEHYGRYDPEEVRADCVNRFSEDVIVRELVTLYQDVLDKQVSLVTS